MLEQMRYETKGVFSMNLMISSLEYDFHSLVKVAEMAGLAGVVSFHQAGDDRGPGGPLFLFVRRIVSSASHPAGYSSGGRGRYFAGTHW